MQLMLHGQQVMPCEQRHKLYGRCPRSPAAQVSLPCVHSKPDACWCMAPVLTAQLTWALLRASLPASPRLLTTAAVQSLTLRTAETGPEVTLGREPPADPALVAAARLMAAAEEGSLQGRSLAQLGDLGMPLTKDAEVCCTASASEQHSREDTCLPDLARPDCSRSLDKVHTDPTQLLQLCTCRPHPHAVAVRGQLLRAQGLSMRPFDSHQRMPVQIRALRLLAGVCLVALNRFETSLTDDEQALTQGLTGPQGAMTPDMLLAISFRAEKKRAVQDGLKTLTATLKVCLWWLQLLKLTRARSAIAESLLAMQDLMDLQDPSRVMRH